MDLGGFMKKRTRTTGVSASVAGLMLAAGAAAAAPAGAAGEASEAGGGYEINRGAVVFNATYLGKADGLRGNAHEISIESEGDGNYIHSYFCPTSADVYTKDGCTLRDQRYITPEKGDVTFWVSSTALSAKASGTLRTFNADSGVHRSFDADLTMRASKWTGPDRGILGADGSVAGMNRDIDPGGFLTLR